MAGGPDRIARHGRGLLAPLECLLLRSLPPLLGRGRRHGIHDGLRDGHVPFCVPFLRILSWSDNTKALITKALFVLYGL